MAEEVTDERPTFGSLFAGIGGLDLGLERAGWRCSWSVEYDAECDLVLRKRFPDVRRYSDVTSIDWSELERVDALVGGFPCQPVSAAGRSLAQADPRWLWPSFARGIAALRPRLVGVENVPRLVVINGGTAFADVLGDLARLGYDAEWDRLAAVDVGAPHLRSRVFVRAYRVRPAPGALPDPGGVGVRVER